MVTFQIVNNLSTPLHQWSTSAAHLMQQLTSSNMSSMDIRLTTQQYCMGNRQERRYIKYPCGMAIMSTRIWRNDTF